MPIMHQKQIYHFKTKPRPHQVRALKFLLNAEKPGGRGGGLQVPM